jgi:hypothetical protein
MENQVEKFMVKTLSNRVSHLESKVTQMETSRSWKITFPLRFIRNILRFQSNQSINDASSEIIENFINNIDKSDSPLFVLFSHEFSNTGAPNVLLQLGTHIKQLKLGEVVFVGHRGVEMLDRFKSVSPSIVIGDDSGSLTVDLDKLIDQIESRFSNVRYVLNTVALSFVATKLSSKGLKFFSWIHELPVSWNILGIENVKNQAILSEFNFVDSALISESLLATFPQLENKVAFVNNAVDLNFGIIDPLIVRQKLGIPENFILISILGTRQPRKGFDFLPFLVNELSKRGYNNGEFCVVWIGLPIYLESELFIIDELKKLQLENSYRLFPASEEFPSIINASNLILSLSREDSNPQILTYAEHLAKPVLKLNDLYSQNNLSWQDNLILLIDKIESETWAKIELSHANKRYIRNWSEVTNEIIKKIDSFYE